MLEMVQHAFWLFSHHCRNGETPEQPAGRAERCHTPEHRQDKTAPSLRAADTVTEWRYISLWKSCVRDITHSFLWLSREWRGSRRQNRRLSHGAAAAESQTTAGCKVKHHSLSDTSDCGVHVLIIKWEGYDTRRPPCRHRHTELDSAQ